MNSTVGWAEFGPNWPQVLDHRDSVEARTLPDDFRLSGIVLRRTFFGVPLVKQVFTSHPDSNSFGAASVNYEAGLLTWVSFWIAEVLLLTTAIVLRPRVGHPSRQG